MRHGKKFNHLGRTAPHRSAMLSNMASSLIKHKRISTTLAKAKALRKYVEPLITKAKDDTTHSRRVVFSYLQDKETVTELFSSVAEKVGNRPGGYTRILKTGNRLGDNADMCIMELVDYNELLVKDKDQKSESKGKTRRSRRGKSKAKASEESVEAAPVVEDAVVVEETTEEQSGEAVEDAPESSAAEEGGTEGGSEEGTEDKDK